MDDFLICPDCGWGGVEDDAMPAEADGVDTLYFCPECGSQVHHAD